MLRPSPVTVPELLCKTTAETYHWISAFFLPTHTHTHTLAETQTQWITPAFYDETNASHLFQKPNWSCSTSKPALTLPSTDRRVSLFSPLTQIQLLSSAFGLHFLSSSFSLSNTAGHVVINKEYGHLCNNGDLKSRKLHPKERGNNLKKTTCLSDLLHQREKRGRN